MISNTYSSGVVDGHFLSSGGLLSVTLGGDGLGEAFSGLGKVLDDLAERLVGLPVGLLAIGVAVVHGLATGTTVDYRRESRRQEERERTM